EDDGWARPNGLCRAPTRPRRPQAVERSMQQHTVACIRSRRSVARVPELLHRLDSTGQDYSVPMQTPTPRQQFLDSFKRETATTLKLMREYPPNKLDLKPTPKSNSARDLVWLFAMEQGLAEKALTSGFDWSTPPGTPPSAPESYDELVKAVEGSFKRTVALVEQMPDSQ